MVKNRDGLFFILSVFRFQLRQMSKTKNKQTTDDDESR